MTLLVFSRGSNGSAIWFQGKDGAPFMQRMESAFLFVVNKGATTVISRQWACDMGSVYKQWTYGLR